MSQQATVNTPESTGIASTAKGFITMFKNMDNHIAAEARRSERARELYKKAKDETDETVSFYMKRHRTQAGLAGHLRVESSPGTVRNAVIAESGWHVCNCPDHLNHGHFCKHLRALSGLLVSEAGRNR